MQSEYYKVYIDNNLVGDYMPLQFALILVKAIYSEFYNELNLKVMIEKQLYEATAEEVKE